MSVGAFEFEANRNWFAPGVMHNASGFSTAVIELLNVPLLSKTLDALISRVSDIDVALCVDGNGARGGELSGLGASLAPRLDEPAGLVELRDALIADAVGSEDVALRIPRDVRRTVEDVLRRADTRRTAPRSAAAFSATTTRCNWSLPAVNQDTIPTRTASIAACAAAGMKGYSGKFYIL